MLKIDKNMLLAHAATIGKLEEDLSQIFGKPLSILLVEKQPDCPVYIPKVETILNHVATHCEVAVDDMVGRSRIRSLTDARAIACKLIRVMHPDLSLSKIGGYFQRDHTTVMNCIDCFENLYATSSDFRLRYDHIKQVLLNQNKLNHD